MEKVINSEVFTQLTQRIINAQNLDEITEVGKELVLYNGNGYKRAIVVMYKARKKEIVQEMLRKNTIFSNLYFLIKLSSGNTLKQVGKLLYNLTDKGILTKGEINYLFDLYESKKSKELKDKEDEENIPVETEEE